MTTSTDTQNLDNTHTKHHELGWRAWLFEQKQWPLVWLDAVLIWVAFLVSYFLRYNVELFQPVDEANFAPFDPYISYTFIFVVWILIGNQSANLYTQQRGRTWANELFSITNTTTNAGLVIMALSFLFQPLVFSRLLIIQAVILTIILLSGVRFGLRVLKRRLQQRGIGVERVLVVGADNLGRHVMRTLVARPDLGYQPIGFLDDDPQLGHTDLGRLTALGSPANLKAMVEKNQINMVIITLPWENHRQIVDIIRQCEELGIGVRAVPDLVQLNLSQVQMEMLGGIPMLGVQREVEVSVSNRLLKRGFDLFLIIVSAPILLPLFMLVALAIRLDSPGPVFFRQERIGLNGKPFRMVKFRSMVVNAEAMWDKVLRESHGIEDPRRPKIVDDPRITRVGRFLRKTSLDELPNLLNVIRGEMSLVGPRPQVRREVELYESWHYQRLKVRPGMTGMWQISGRSDIPFDEMCLLDIYYIENWSVGLDLQILLQTVPRVVMGVGAY